jgi:flagellar biosynthesis/type III secretory pathway chaperone
MINKLIEIIGREAGLFESFLALLEQQQKMLVSNDLEGLNHVTDRQREKLVESQLLNKEREQLIERIRVANAIEGDLNVTRLLAMVDENQAARLLHLKGLIYGLHDQIAEVRNQNAMLLSRSRQYIGKMMEMLSRVNSPEGAYSSGGVATASNSTVAVDRRA